MMKRRFLACGLLVAGIAAAQAQDLSAAEALHALLANALEVRIAARILPTEEGAAWNVESKKLTLPGRSVNVRLDGDNVRIFLECTPYIQDSGEVLLLAKGQVWFTEPPEKKARYFSTFSTIPLEYGEKVLYFPLGLSEQSQALKDHFNVELEIVIVPYSPADATDKAQESSQDAAKDNP